VTAASMAVLEDCFVVNPRPDADVRMLMFHHAGGSALSLLPLARATRSDVEVRLIELPGRGLQEQVPAAETFDAALGLLLDRTSTLFDRPTVLFGHSLGGLLTDALARALPEQARAQLRLVVVSACEYRPAAADPLPAAPPPAQRGHEDLVRELVVHGGTPREVFDSPELLARSVRLLGHDMRLVDSYVPRSGSAGPSVPYEIWYGTEDPTVVPRPAATWSSGDRAPVRVRRFPGGHFYLLDETGSAARALDESLRAVVDAVHAPRRTGQVPVAREGR